MDTVERIDRIAELEDQVARLSRDNIRLSNELQILLNRILRTKNERMDSRQLSLFLDGIEEATEESAPEFEEPSPKKKGKGHGRRPFRKDLPRITETLDLTVAERCCSDCGEALRRIGEDVTERGEIIPAKMLVKRYVRPKYACPQGHGMKVAPLPPTLVGKSKYEPSVYAHLATAKYADHQPLHRLEGMFRRHGFDLPKQTMWEMLRRLDEIVARPILAQMKTEVLQHRILQVDETPVTVQLEDSKGAKKAYIWGYGWKGKRFYDFTMTRERDGPCRVLGDWKGTLQMDGYSGYDEVVRRNGLVRAGCWAHVRRKLKDAMDTGSKDAARVLLPIQLLFRIDSVVSKRIAARQLSEEEGLELRAKVRKRSGRRALNRIRSAAEALLSERSTLPRSVLGKALTYLERQWATLLHFLDDPELPLHNNDAERHLRHLALGRRNWYFFGSKKGGEVGANLSSLMLACKSLDLDPERYVTEVIRRIDTTPASQIASLTPWALAHEIGTVSQAATA